MSQKLVGTICKYYSKTWLTCALKVALAQRAHMEAKVECV